ncbi:MAG: hypothetical protein QGG17_02495 [Rhodospirillales bacterium]|nr:hypothetical protein [Rhodospirillales bacterium]MDP6805307.1 hypothetical protein [Rhodospirillales bacterium]
MSVKFSWLAVLAAAYAGWCLVVAWRSARQGHTVEGFLVGERRIAAGPFVLAATAASFSGWILLGQPALIHRDGFPFGIGSLGAVVVPLTGVLFLKRQWILGRRFGFVTPGEMMGAYFGGEAMRAITVIVALLFALPFAGLLLGASGHVFSWLTDGVIDAGSAVWIVALIPLATIAAGGVRAVTLTGAVQGVLLVGAALAGGWAVLEALGGWDAFRAALAELGASVGGRWGTTGGLGGGDYNSLFAMPGAIQFVTGVARDTPQGGLWTGAFTLTFALTFLGIQAAPAFSVWAFSAARVQGFATQQIWASAFAIGLVLVGATTVLGMGARLLGVGGGEGHPVFVLADQWNLAPNDQAALSLLDAGGVITPDILALVNSTSPFLGVVFAIAAIAALHTAAAAHVSAGATVLVRDVLTRVLPLHPSDARVVIIARIAAVALLVGAVALATGGREILLHLGSLALAIAAQLWIPLAAVTWFAWITRAGATWGFVAGCLGVVITEPLGLAVLSAAGVDAWGRWPWTIHSAGWGLAANVCVSFVVSAFTQAPAGATERDRFHATLREHAGLSREKRGLVPLAWALTLAWFFFALGPGALIGNDVFGTPDAGVAGWTFGIPSLWAWQIAFWLLGVGLIAFLARTLGLSAPPHGPVAGAESGPGTGAGGHA